MLLVPHPYPHSVGTHILLKASFYICLQRKQAENTQELMSPKQLSNNYKEGVVGKYSTNIFSSDSSEAQSSSSPRGPHENPMGTY